MFLCENTETPAVLPSTAATAEERGRERGEEEGDRELEGREREREREREEREGERRRVMDQGALQFVLILEVSGREGWKEEKVRKRPEDGRRKRDGENK